MIRWEISALLLLPVALPTANGIPQPLEPPATQCADTGSTADGARRINILIVGESWANHGHLFPDLPRDVAPDGAARACAMAFPGRRTEEIGRLFRSVPRHAIEALFDGRPIDQAVILNGVNDLACGVAPARYAADTAKLAADIRSLTSAIAVVSIPDVRPPSPSGLSRIFAWNDRGGYSVSDYRRALGGSGAGLHVIDYALFLGPFARSRDHFRPDGRHLTDAEFHRYGSFIGSQLAQWRGTMLAGQAAIRISGR